jgi:hypothetical protein
MEGHDPHRPGGAADEELYPLAHLLRGAVREGDREDLVRAGLARAQQPRDAVGQHARLARSRAGEDEQRAVRVRHRIALGRVEPLEERVDGGVGHAVTDGSGPGG